MICLIYIVHLNQLPKGYKQAMHYLHLPPKEIVVAKVTKFFTDVLGANAAGMKSILLTPKEMEHSLHSEYAVK